MVEEICFQVNSGEVFDQPKPQVQRVRQSGVVIQFRRAAAGYFVHAVVDFVNQFGVREQAVQIVLPQRSPPVVNVGVEGAGREPQGIGGQQVGRILQLH